MDITILGIESSCDDTSAAVIRNTTLLSNVIASQAVHMKYGGVIPELASRAHQQNIVPVVDTALKEAGVAPDELDAIAFTRGPGLLGSLLVGVSFAKGLALAHDHPDGRGEPLAGTYPLALPRPADRTRPTPTSRSSACSSAADIRRSCGWTRRWRWRSSARRSTTPQEKRSTSVPK